MNSNKQHVEELCLTCFSDLKIHNITYQYKEIGSLNKAIQILCKKSFSLATSDFKAEQDIICKDENNDIYIALVFYQKVTMDLLRQKLKILIGNIKQCGGNIQFHIIPIEISGIMFKPNVTVNYKMEYSKVKFMKAKYFYKILNNVIDINKLDKKDFIEVRIDN